MTDNSIPEESRVEFHGPGPFDLPVAQQSKAYRSGHTVEVAFRVLVDPSRLEAVRIAIPSNQALELGVQMTKAAIVASSEDK